MESASKWLASFLIIANAVAVSGQVSGVVSIGALTEVLIPLLSDDDVNAELVTDVLDAYNGDDWANYAFCTNDTVRFNLADAVEGQFGIMLACVPGGQSWSIHDHTSGYVFWKVVGGAFLDNYYLLPTSLGVMSRIDYRVIKTGQVGHDDVDYGLVYGLENISLDKSAVLLFVASPPYNLLTVYDPLTGVASLVEEPFYSEFGKLVETTKK